MDTTEQYIKMCEQAWEIQEQNKFAYWGDGDTYYSPRAQRVFMFTMGLGDVAKSHLPGEVWLPRQDQLQNMMRTKYDLPNICVEFYCFISGRVPLTNEIFANPIWETFTSMEQLWLAFVMQEKYGKVWGGESWAD